jgi:hypothetical protein
VEASTKSSLERGSGGQRIFKPMKGSDSLFLHQEISSAVGFDNLCFV